MFKRLIFNTIFERLKAKRQFIQVLTGPRQVGKTTLAKQIATQLDIPFHYASADVPGLRGSVWLEQQWDIAHINVKEQGGSETLLIIDEVQKVPDWSEIVKKLWDEDTFNQVPVKVMLLGSTPLLIEKSLTESLADRFENIPMPHWFFPEMQEAFDFTLEQYIYFGGYPGAASLIQDEKRWSDYIVDSLIETTLGRDILLMSHITKPALLRRLFQFACDYSGQILSYQKMLGQLNDAGNTTTLAHYLHLLSSAGMVTGLQKYSPTRVTQRGSSPKLQVMNTALMTASSHISFRDTIRERSLWGRLVESAVAATLVNQIMGSHIELFYWREQNLEVDYVLALGNQLVALEVKSSAKQTETSVEAFAKKYKPTKILTIGRQGLSLEKFLNLRIQSLIH